LELSFKIEELIM